MEIVLLERVENLGHLGEVVNVKPGYARNFLLPQKKALRATKSNLEYFERRKSDLKALNDKRRAEAEITAKKVDGLVLVIIRQASEAGHLYGSVAARDIVEAVAAMDKGVALERRQVILVEPVKTLGISQVRISLHPEVSVSVKINVARSAEEAKIQLERGEAVKRSDQPQEEEAPQAAEVFELNVEQPDV